MAVSVIIRARDEQARIARCLGALAGQREVDAPELIVVDNDSRDDTAAIARDAGAQVVELAREAFTFGGALNLGAAHAGGEILVALSADALPADPLWLARLLAAMTDPGVACACGQRFLPSGAELDRPLRQTEPSRPPWGYSNGAGAFRASLWRARPFRTDLPGCEDLEWSAYWLRRGYACVIDPALGLAHDHTHDRLASIYRRARREAAGIARFTDAPPPRTGELIAAWWSDLRFYDSALRARLSHRRAARLLGAHVGGRRR